MAQPDVDVQPETFKPSKICWLCGHVSTPRAPVKSHWRWLGGTGDILQDECYYMIDCAKRIDAQYAECEATGAAWPDYKAIAQCRNTRDLMWWIHRIDDPELLDELEGRYRAIKAIEQRYGDD